MSLDELFTSHALTIEWPQLEVYAVSRCVVFDGDFISCVSVCTLVLVCPGYDQKLPKPSVDANDLCC